MTDNTALSRSQYAIAHGFFDRVRKSLNGRTLKWLSDETGISQSALTDYSKRKMPGADRAMAIAEALNVDLDWLLRGTVDAPAPGAMLERHPPWSPHHQPPGMVEIARIDLNFGLGAAFMDQEIVEHQAEKLAFPLAWLRQITSSSPEQLYWTRGLGNSMEPAISDGDVILIDRSMVGSNFGDLYWAIAYGQTGMIKRLRPMPDGSVKILSDNQNVPPEVAYDGELHVFGRVIAAVRRL